MEAVQVANGSVSTARASGFTGARLRLSRRQPARLASKRPAAVSAVLQTSPTDVQRALSFLGTQPAGGSKLNPIDERLQWKANLGRELLERRGSQLKEGGITVGEIADVLYRLEKEKYGDNLKLPLMTTAGRFHDEGTSPDLSFRDAAGKVVFYVLLWKRHGLQQALFDDYWKNVHGPVCARLPGQHQYWQFHVGHSEGGLWQTAPGIEYDTNAESSFDGIAELTFRTDEDRNLWFKASAILMDDEHNVFRKALGYTTAVGNSFTYMDYMRSGSPLGVIPAVKFHVLIRAQDGVSVDAFREYMQGFARELYFSPELIKLRLHLFDGLNVDRPDAAGVAHSDPPEKFYQAALEVAFSTRLDMELFFESQRYKNAISTQAQFVKRLLVLPETTAYTFVYDDKMTLAGLRSAEVARNIIDIGATNQLRDDIGVLMEKGWTG
eukprot:jgi/Chlat1/1660/Chrsp127S01897